MDELSGYVEYMGWGVSTNRQNWLQNADMIILWDAGDRERSRIRG